MRVRVCGVRGRQKGKKRRIGRAEIGRRFGRPWIGGRRQRRRGRVCCGFGLGNLRNWESRASWEREVLESAKRLASDEHLAVR